MKYFLLVYSAVLSSSLYAQERLQRYQQQKEEITARYDAAVRNYAEDKMLAAPPRFKVEIVYFVVPLVVSAAVALGITAACVTSECETSHVDRDFAVPFIATCGFSSIALGCSIAASILGRLGHFEKRDEIRRKFIEDKLKADQAA